MEEDIMKNTIKRIGMIALVIVLCLGMATSALAASTATVTASSLNVRAGVGTQYKVLQALSRNTQVYYLGVSDVDNDGDLWYKVQYGAYGTGWVFADYCDLSDYTATSYCTANSGDTYIRSNPNLEGSKLGVLKQGSTAYYLGQVMTDDRGVDWYYVNSNGTYGWVSTVYTYLHTENSFGLNVMPTLPAYGATKGTIKSEGGDAYIRSTGSLSGAELAVLKEGYSATYLNERTVDERGVVWFKVSYNGTTGWISARYASLQGNAPVSLPTTSSKNYVKATGGKCNLRKEPNLDAKVLTSMEKGETATYLKETAIDERGVIWYKAKFDGMTGWVSSKYASLNSTGNTSSETDIYGSFVYAQAQTNVRKQPNLNGKVLDVMQKDDRATYSGSTSIDDRGVAWYSVRFGGTNGWVSSKYTEIQ